MASDVNWYVSVTKSTAHNVDVPRSVVGNSTWGGAHAQTEYRPREPEDCMLLTATHTPGRLLTFVQTNILVDSCGRARVAGLGTALLPSADGFFHGTAPELVDPPRFGLTDAGTTKASDVYAFGVLAWEVGPTLSVSWTTYSRKWAVS